MKIDELRALQDTFCAHMETEEYINEKERLKNLLESFVKDFPPDEILRLSIDDFVVGRGDRGSFCNRLENELNDWGNIHGSTAIKFGIYFGKRGDVENEYHHAARFGTTTEEAFKGVKGSIVSLINDGADGDISELKKNAVSPMVKGKILSIYYPTRYLNVFSEKHLKFFMGELGLADICSDEIDMREALVRFKNSDVQMKLWDLYAFNKFLYKSLFGIDAYNNSRTSPLDVTPSVEDMTVGEFSKVIAGTGDGKSGKTDYEEQGRNKRRIGEKGEVIVLLHEKKELMAKGLKMYADKVTKVSDSDDRAGYDILSYEERGKKRYIEVKSTVNNNTPATYYISENELNKLSKLDNSYIYFVTDVDGDTPRIRRFKFGSRDQIEGKLSPIAYQFKA